MDPLGWPCLGCNYLLKATSCWTNSHAIQFLRSMILHPRYMNAHITAVSIYITQITRCSYSILCSLFVLRAQIIVCARNSICICITWLIFITSDRLALNPQIYTLLRASANFIMDVPWHIITISSLAGSFGLVRLAPQYSPSKYFVATFLLVFLGEIIAAITWQAILWPRFISPLRHLPEPQVRSTF